MKALSAMRLLPRPLRRPFRLVTTVALAAASLFLAPSWIMAQEAAPEAEVKAAFLINFMKYAEWPEGVMQRGSLRACVGDSKPTLDALSPHVGRPVKGVPLEARAVEPGDALEECHALYVAKPSDPAWRQAVNRLGEKPVLTVVETEFDAMGLPTTPSSSEWIIRVDLSGKRLLFDANLRAAGRKGIGLSSQLLKLARAVEK